MFIKWKFHTSVGKEGQRMMVVSLNILKCERGALYTIQEFKKRAVPLGRKKVFVFFKIL
jgi:hypothetical protein